TFLELGPDAVLSAMAQDCLIAPGQVDDEAPSRSAVSVLAPALRAGRPEAESLLGAIARIWTNGVGVGWKGMFSGADAVRVDLPTYAFQRERYWLTASAGTEGVTSAGLLATGHPLLAAAAALADDSGWLFTGLLSLESQPWLADHVVLGSCVVPGAAFAELALHAAAQIDTLF